jgi:hypothetical protein
MALPSKYRDIVKAHTVLAAGAGVTSAFIPDSDIGVICTIWVTMFVQILSRSGHEEISSSVVKKTILSILGGITMYLTGCKIFFWILNLIPGIGTFASIGLNAFINALFTYRFGDFCSITLDKADFDGDDMMHLAERVLSCLLVIPGLSEIQDVIDFYKS